MHPFRIGNMLSMLSVSGVYIFHGTSSGFSKCSHRVVFQFSLMKVDDVGAHAIQKVLRVRD